MTGTMGKSHFWTPALAEVSYEIRSVRPHVRTAISQDWLISFF